MDLVDDNKIHRKRWGSSTKSERLAEFPGVRTDFHVVK